MKTNNQTPVQNVSVSWKTSPFFGEEGAMNNSRKGVNLARNIGTRDQSKRSQERPASVTCVRKSDEHK
jgi:hypothetical protein